MTRLTKINILGIFLLMASNLIICSTNFEFYRIQVNGVPCYKYDTGTPDPLDKNKSTNLTIGAGDRATFKLRDYKGEKEVVIYIDGDLIVNGNCYVGFEPDGFRTSYSSIENSFGNFDFDYWGCSYIDIEKQYDRIIIMVKGKIKGNGNLMLLRKWSDKAYYVGTGWRVSGACGAQSYEARRDGYSGVFHDRLRAFVPQYGKTVIYCMDNIELNGGIYIYYGWVQFDTRAHAVQNGNNEEWNYDIWSKAGSGTLSVACAGTNNVIGKIYSKTSPSNIDVIKDDFKKYNLSCLYYPDYLDNEKDQMRVIFIEDISLRYGFDPCLDVVHYWINLFGLINSIDSFTDGGGAVDVLDTTTSSYSLIFENKTNPAAILEAFNNNISNSFLGDDGNIYFLSGINMNASFNIDNISFIIQLVNLNTQSFFLNNMNSSASIDLKNIFCFILSKYKIEPNTGQTYGDLYFFDGEEVSYDYIISILHSKLGDYIRSKQTSKFAELFNVNYTLDSVIQSPISMFNGIPAAADSFDYINDPKDGRIFKFKKLHFSINGNFTEFNYYNFGINLNLKTNTSLSVNADLISFSSMNPQLSVVNSEYYFQNGIFGAERSATTWDYINTSSNEIFIRLKVKMDRLPNEIVYNLKRHAMISLSTNIPYRTYYIDDSPLFVHNEVLNCYSKEFYIISQYTGLNAGSNTLTTNISYPLSNLCTTDKIVNKIGTIDKKVNNIVLKERNDIGLTPAAVLKEEQIWKSPDILNDTNYKDISSIGESLSINSFNLTGNLFKVEISLPNTDCFTDNINLIELKGAVNLGTEESKTRSLFYVIYDTGDTADKIDIYTDTGEKIADADESRYYELSDDGKIKKIFGYYNYTDFFSSLTTQNSNTLVVFPDIFGKPINFSARGIKILDHNYFHDDPILNSNDKNLALQTFASSAFLKSIFEDKENDSSINVEEASFVREDDYLTNKKSFNTPYYPSRIGLFYTDLDVSNNVPSLFLSPTVRIPGIAAYQMIAINEEDFNTYYGGNENNIFPLFDQSVSSSQIKTPPVNPGESNNNLWAKNVSTGFYKSQWINNNVNAVVRLGAREGVDFIMPENSPQKIHFFTKAATIEGANYTVSTATRHTSINLNQSSFYQTISSGGFTDNPGPYVDDGDGDDNCYTIHVNVRFTGDVYIPVGKTLKFSVSSNFVQNNIVTEIPNLAIDNNIHFFIAGSLVIDKGTQDEYIIFGPSKMTTLDWTTKVETQGMWGGINILDTGTFTANGAWITNAIDGVILKNNGSKSSLDNINITNCENGLHLFNSYPLIGNNVIIAGNTLYGVKEDKMNNKAGFSNWQLTDAQKLRIYLNGYNYYNYNFGIEK